MIICITTGGNVNWEIVWQTCQSIQNTILNPEQKGVNPTLWDTAVGDISMSCSRYWVQVQVECLNACWIRSVKMFFQQETRNVSSLLQHPLIKQDLQQSKTVWLSVDPIKKQKPRKMIKKTVSTACIQKYAVKGFTIIIYKSKFKSIQALHDLGTLSSSYKWWEGDWTTGVKEFVINGFLRPATECLHPESPSSLEIQCAFGNFLIIFHGRLILRQIQTSTVAWNLLAAVHSKCEIENVNAHNLGDVHVCHSRRT